VELAPELAPYPRDKAGEHHAIMPAAIARNSDLAVNWSGGPSVAPPKMRRSTSPICSSIDGSNASLRSAFRIQPIS